MPIQTFRTKPVEVQAVEVRGWTNAREVCEWADAYFVAKGYEHVLRRENEQDRSTGHVLDHAPEFLDHPRRPGRVLPLQARHLRPDLRGGIVTGTKPNSGTPADQRKKGRGAKPGPKPGSKNKK